MEEGVGVGFGVEGGEVFEGFSKADVADRDFAFAVDGESDAAFCRAVDFCEDEAGDGDVGIEDADLLYSCLAKGGIHDEVGLMWRELVLFSGNSAHLFEFFEEVCFGFESSGGVANDDIKVFCSGFSHGVKQDA